MFDKPRSDPHMLRHVYGFILADETKDILLSGVRHRSTATARLQPTLSATAMSGREGTGCRGSGVFPNCL